MMYPDKFNKKIMFTKFMRFFSQFKPKQIIDSYWQVQRKVQELASALNSSKHAIIFTGAGISTSLGIPDYRSGTETLIKTGPGLWNRDHSQPNPHETPIDKLVDAAKPSLSHMAIATLIKHNKIAHLVSQNTDGLHVRSGIPLDRISELHGNRNLQFCIICQRKYTRDFRTLKRDGKKYYPGQKRDHSTGRSCQNCGGELHDSIVYFGQKLPSQHLQNAVIHANQADLCLCIGSSLTVKPSSNIPALVAKKAPAGKLFIINIQETPLDSLAELRINYFCDEVMELLAEKMGVTVEPLVVRHFLRIGLEEDEEGWVWMDIEGKDQHGYNLTFIKEVIIGFEDSREEEVASKGHKCLIKLEKNRIQMVKTVKIVHYGEKTPLTLEISRLNLAPSKAVSLNYSTIDDKTWKIQHISTS